jgi:hypothetical protein
MNQVTFLLFLASLAVMEYLVRKPRKKAGDNPKAGASRSGTTKDAMAAGATMPGLLALGQALDAQGHGEVPDVEQVPRVHVPPVDGV